ncbi:hypothetical protein C8R44DRAFT_988599 [Mycena epipterygia]|nr:hypothetical protein C8R44DRAFT_988599 [Mycena epipterygia]
MMTRTHTLFPLALGAAPPPPTLVPSGTTTHAEDEDDEARLLLPTRTPAGMILAPPLILPAITPSDDACMTRTTTSTSRSQHDLPTMNTTTTSESPRHSCYDDEHARTRTGVLHTTLTPLAPWTHHTR